VAGPQGRRRIPIDRFWRADGVRNHGLAAGDILVAVRIPKTPCGHRGAYGKLRDRGAIDYPLLGVAARLDVDGDGVVCHSDVVLTGLAATPRRVQQAGVLLRGTRPATPGFASQVAEVAEAAFCQCHPIENIAGDAAWRREMVRVYVRRTLARCDVSASGDCHEPTAPLVGPDLRLEHRR
jgi:4-hydroxybenzoyl-CoA reductase subunit beta